MLSIKSKPPTLSQCTCENIARIIADLTNYRFRCPGSLMLCMLELEEVVLGLVFDRLSTEN